MIVLKYGGSVVDLDAHVDPVLSDVAVRVREGDQVVIVHGGGPQINEELAVRGVRERRVNGLRVTDAATLAVVEMVLAARVNKALVRRLLMLGVPAVGISGEDGAMLVARKRVAGEDLGFVGDVERVDAGPLRALVHGGFVPVVAPLGVAADASTAYNINADTAAGAIAAALHAAAFVQITDVAKVRRDLTDPTSGIDRLEVRDAERFLADGTFTGGMIPKIEAALVAVRGGAERAVIGGGGGGPNPLLDALGGAATEIVP